VREARYADAVGHGRHEGSFLVYWIIDRGDGGCQVSVRYAQELKIWKQKAERYSDGGECMQGIEISCRFGETA
jgi:hypothetical protein